MEEKDDIKKTCHDHNNNMGMEKGKHILNKKNMHLMKEIKNIIKIVIIM